VTVEKARQHEEGVDQLTAQPEQDPRTIERAKQQVRDRIWALLEREGAAKPPARPLTTLGIRLGRNGHYDRTPES
jgi:hypothetical protein